MTDALDPVKSCLPTAGTDVLDEPTATPPSISSLLHSRTSGRFNTKSWRLSSSPSVSRGGEQQIADGSAGDDAEVWSALGTARSRSIRVVKKVVSLDNVLVDPERRRWEDCLQAPGGAGETTLRSRPRYSPKLFCWRNALSIPTRIEISTRCSGSWTKTW